MIETGTPPSDGIQFCSTCNKPFTSTISHRRHQAYCRRAQTRSKKRPKSCQACNTAKVKCSFEMPCSRCAKKALKCVYGEAAYSPAHQQYPNTPVSPTSMSSRTHAASGNLVPSYGMFTSNDSALALAESMVGVRDANKSGYLDELQADTVQDDLLWNFSNLDDVDNFLVDQQITMSDLLQSSESTTDTSHYLVKISPEKPLVKQNANLILEALCAIPEQMLRRQTLPPFIHPHWHLPNMPEPLAVCMDIALLFSRRTPATAEFLWRTILAESKRAVERIPSYTAEGLLAAVQAGMVYVIMRVVDGPMQSPEWNQEMTFYQNILCNAFLEMFDGKFCESEAENPSTTWQEWIFAESRRRTSCVWFLIARTIMVKAKPGCPTTEAPWTLPLPSPKTQWEARTFEDWLPEIEAGAPAINDFGSLIEARQKWNEPVHARKLDSWNARTDTLGSLLNIAVSMV